MFECVALEDLNFALGRSNILGLQEKWQQLSIVGTQFRKMSLLKNDT